MMCIDDHESHVRMWKLEVVACLRVLSWNSSVVDSFEPDVPRLEVLIVTAVLTCGIYLVWAAQWGS